MSIFRGLMNYPDSLMVATPNLLVLVVKVGVWYKIKCI